MNGVLLTGQVQAAGRVLHRADAVPRAPAQEPGAAAAAEGRVVRHGQ